MATNVLGRLVTAAEVEHLRADGGPTDFVRLCGALIGRAIGERVGSYTVPSITERVDVKDGGVDAEYVAPPSSRLPETNGLVGPGRTVYQFKYKDTSADSRRSLVGRIRRAVREEAAKLVASCDRYVFITNLHLTPMDVRRLRDDFVGAAPVFAGRPVVIWGAAEVALALNSTPHLRHLFFAQGGLSTLDYVEVELRQAYRAFGWPPFIDREREVARVQAFLEDGSARLLSVTGPRYVGKTRLVIEALRVQGAQVLWASDASRATDPDLFRDLDSADVPGVLVVDGVEPRRADAVEALARARDRMKTIIIGSGSAAGTSEPNRLYVGPWRDGNPSLRLVEAMAPSVSPGDQWWIVDRAGGNPGFLIYLTGLVRQARQGQGGSGDDVVAQIGELLESALLSTVDAESRTVLEMLSLLPAIGLEGEVLGQEAAKVAEVWGVPPGSLPSRIASLERAGVVRQAGRFVEVIPPLLAEYLAAKALLRPELSLAELRLHLPEKTGAFHRFLIRLRDLRSPAIRDAIRRLFAADGWFPTRDDLLAGTDVIELLAPAAPREALALLQRHLGQLTTEALRAALTRNARRAWRVSLVGILADLLLHSTTFEGAARLLLQLAEAEIEPFSSAARESFVGVFHWAHPQVPVGLALRLRVLQEAASAPAVARRRIAAQASGRAFDPGGAGDMRPVAGARLPEPPHMPSAEETAHYAAGVLGLLKKLTADTDATVLHEAASALRITFPAFLDAGLDGDRLLPIGIDAIDSLASVGTAAPDASSRATVVSELELARRRLADDREPGGTGVAEAISRIEQAIDALTESSFEARLLRWVGPRSLGQDEAEVDGDDIGAPALDEIAQALAADHEAFARHVPWLTGIEARQRVPLFLRLGRLDRGDGLFRRLVSSSSDSPFWPDVFAAYCRGWHEVEPGEVHAVLDELAASRPDLARGLIVASGQVSQGTVDRLLRLFEHPSVAAAETVQEAAESVRWEDLEGADAERLLRRLAEVSPDGPSGLLFAYIRRLRLDAPLDERLRELAWEFLEAAPPVDDRMGRAGNWDWLAGKLGRDEPARLLSLLRRKLEAQTDLGGQPRDPRDRLYDVLTTLEVKDRAGLVRTLLELYVAGSDPVTPARLLRSLISAEKDRPVILEVVDEHGVEWAVAIVGRLDADDPGFFEVARRLLTRVDADDSVRLALLGRLGSGAWSGSRVPSLERRLAGARALKNDAEPAVQAWAAEAEATLEEHVKEAKGEEQERWMWDYRVSSNQLRTLLAKKDSAERLWAIGRLLQDAPFERVRDLLQPQEIAEALPKLSNLDEGKRRMWDAYARLHGGVPH